MADGALNLAAEGIQRGVASTMTRVVAVVMEGGHVGEDRRGGGCHGRGRIDDDDGDGRRVHGEVGRWCRQTEEDLRAPTPSGGSKGGAGGL